MAKSLRAVSRVDNVYFNPNNQTEQSEAILQKNLHFIIEQCADGGQQVSSIATGYTGIAFLFQYLVKNDLLEPNDIPYLNEINPYIIRFPIE
ncbi:MAG: hypothetical protein ACI8ZM_001991 [Crocinitomix sp.]